MSSLRSSACASACTSSMRFSCSQIWPVSASKCTCVRRSSAALATDVSFLMPPPWPGRRFHQMVKCRCGLAPAGAGVGTGRKRSIASIDQILPQFGLRFYQIIKRELAKTGPAFCCAARKVSLAETPNRPCRPMGCALSRTTQAACCGADGTSLAISLPRMTGARSMPGISE